jgi:signal transduction histidine kinase
MLQVLANLITNAIKFTRGGAIRVHGERGEGEVRLSVADTGVGIPPHLLERIFERFWQVGVNDSRGLGLGLYISRSIVEAHGGRIWAESADGAGSTFFVTLPTTPD